jgi:plastocyanin
MTRFLAVAAVLAAYVAALVGTAGASSRIKLFGTVGKNNAFKIVLLDPMGAKVTKLKAGTYTFVIHDDSSSHNYELDGPNGKNWTFTSVGFVGTKTVTLKLTAGKYKAFCKPHESFMFQNFTVR